MDGVTLLQAVPGEINIFSIVLCIIFGIVGLIFVIVAIAVIIEGDDVSFLVIIPGIVLIIGSLSIGFTARDNRLAPENCYYYATIDDNITMNEFFKHYDLIQHKSDSSLWLIKEKNNQMEEN